MLVLLVAILRDLCIWPIASNSFHEEWGSHGMRIVYMREAGYGISMVTSTNYHAYQEDLSNQYNHYYKLH